jgi:hypothetical protein
MQRCTNPKNPDYQQYGGRGIEFRFTSPTELVAAIGMRPAGMTLDRIDSGGHYEVGNVRWATPKEQANNRGTPEYFRQQAARNWLLCLKCINEPHNLSKDEKSCVEDLHTSSSLPYATFWEHGYNEPTNYVVLPSVNEPGGRVVMRVGPHVGSTRSSMTGRGLLEGTQNITLSANCSEDEVKLFREFVNGCRRNSGPFGLRYSRDHFFNNDNRIEGRLLAAAGRLTALKQNARVLLAAQVAAALVVDDLRNLLGAEYLFVPDLGVWGSAYAHDGFVTHRLYEILKERECRRLPTVVYVEDIQSMSSKVASMLEYCYGNADLSKIKPLHHPAGLVEK